MLASGQMGFDIKNNYIKQSLRSNGLDQSAPIGRSPPENIREEKEKDQNEPAPNHQIASSYPEETFNLVNHKLKLNQSAMLPDKQGVANQKLEDLAGKSDSVLLKVSTFWPMTFFVHDIIVDPYKVNIIFREFFWSEHIHSVLIKDILDVVVETSIFFATIRIVDQGYVENTIDIAYLKRGDALKVRKIIQGLIIAHRQAVDLSILPISDIRTQVEELGKVKGIDKETINF